jgi:hypothetical protein
MSFIDIISKVSKPIFGDTMDSFLHPEKSYERAMEEMNRRFQEAKGYILPYQQHGLEQYGTLQGGINNLLNPESLMSRFTSGYETSPYAKQLLGLNRQSGLDEASKMGLMGSSAALGNIQQGAGNIVAADREKYLRMLMDQYLKGLGLSEDIYNTGAGAASSLMGGGMRQGENAANLRFGASASPGQLFQNLLRTGMQAFGGGMGGGGGFLS